jgi:valyl-tRNA synthetase
VRLLAPFVPYITEEVWQWAYAGDADMHRSVHASPWPVAAELSVIPTPKVAGVWDVAVEVVDLLRKAKADANKSMAAPLRSADVLVKAAAVPALQSVLEDIKGMLRVGTINVVAGEGDNAVSSVAVVFEEVA